LAAHRDDSAITQPHKRQPSRSASTVASAPEAPSSSPLKRSRRHRPRREDHAVLVGTRPPAERELSDQDHLQTPTGCGRRRRSPTCASTTSGHPLLVAHWHDHRRSLGPPPPRPWPNNLINRAKRRLLGKANPTSRRPRSARCGLPQLRAQLLVSMIDGLVDLPVLTASSSPGFRLAATDNGRWLCRPPTGRAPRFWAPAARQQHVMHLRGPISVTSKAPDTSK
jgi:hypothetical protein